MPRREGLYSARYYQNATQKIILNQKYKEWGDLSRRQEPSVPKYESQRGGKGYT